MKLSSHKIRFVLGAVALALATGLCAAYAEGASLPAANARKAAPDFTLQDASGASFKLSDYRGKVVLLDFWATWCHGCKTEIPWYMEFQNKYKDRGLSVIGISMDDGWKPVKAYIAEQKVNYRVAVGDDKVTELYKIHNMPVTLLIDKNGRIVDTKVGVVDKDTFEKEIQALLQEWPQHTYSSCTIFPPTIVATARPVKLQPSNGVFFDFDRDCEASKVHFFFGSKMVTSA